MIASLVLVALQDAAPPTPARPDPDRIGALTRVAEAVPAFRAEYRVSVAGREGSTTIRVLYRGPDAARIDVGERDTFELRGGFLDARIRRGGDKPAAAHVAVSEPILARYRRVAEAVRAELPALAAEWPDSVEPGVRFDLSVGDPTGAAERALQLNASYAVPRPARFGWLEGLASKPFVADGADRLRFEDPADPGTVLVLSAKTGFLERAEKEQGGSRSTLELVSLDLEPEIEDADLDLEPPPDGAADVSLFFAERVQRVQTRKHRRDVLRSVARLVAKGELAWDDAARAKLARVLERVHGDAWTSENEAWVADMRARMGQFVDWLAERRADPAMQDGPARESLDRAVADWRAALAASAGADLEARLADLTIEEEITADPKLRATFLEIERAAVRKTLASSLVDPLLRELDERVASARPKR